MSNNTEGWIRQALFKAVEETLTGKKVRWPNVKFTPPSQGIWFGVSHLPADRMVSTLGDGGEDRAIGILQIDVNIGLDTGEAALEQDLKALENRFVPGAVVIYENNKATISACRRLPGREAFGFWRVSIEARYYASVTRKLPTT